jgi:hypothetical protein
VTLEIVSLRYFTIPPASRHFYISLRLRSTALWVHDSSVQAAHDDIHNLEVWGFTSECAKS